MKKKKKHTILGGIKVSFQQLSEWGSLRGRPIKYNSHEEKREARRAQRAIRMGKDPTTLRSYKSVVEKKTQSIQKGIIIYNDPETKQFPRASIGQCSYCKSEVLGSPQTQGSQCQACHRGVYQIQTITITTTKRAKTRAEINREYYLRRKTCLTRLKNFEIRSH